MTVFLSTRRGCRPLYNTSWQVVEERKNGSDDPSIQYVWDARYIDAPVCRDKDTSNGSGGDPDGDCIDSDDQHLYYCTDANFNVTSLVEGDGDVVERYVYDPYGKVTVLHGADDADGAVTEWDEDTGGSDWDNEILYSGYRYDPETHLYHVRHRMYHATLGRWMQRDPPLGYVDGMSLYEYCTSQPGTACDPYGTEPVTITVLGLSIYEVCGLAFAAGVAADIHLTNTVPEYREGKEKIGRKIGEVIDDIVKAVKNIGKGPRGPKSSPPRADPPLPKPPVPTGPPPGSGGPVQNPLDPTQPVPRLDPGEGFPPGTPGHLGAAPFGRNDNWTGKGSEGWGREGYGWQGWDGRGDDGGGGIGHGPDRNRQGRPAGAGARQPGAGAGAGQPGAGRGGGPLPWKDGGPADGPGGAGGQAGLEDLVDELLEEERDLFHSMDARPPPHPLPGGTFSKTKK